MKRGRWTTDAAVGTEAREDGPPHIAGPDSGTAGGARPSNPSSQSSAPDSSPHCPRAPSFHSSLDFPNSCRGCACACRAGRRRRMGCMHRSAAVEAGQRDSLRENAQSSQPVRDPEPKQEAAPQPKRPQPGFPPGWGRNDSPPSLFPRFLVCVSSPAAWRPYPRSPYSQKPLPPPQPPLHTPRTLRPPGFLREAKVPAASGYPRPDPAPCWSPPSPARAGRVLPALLSARRGRGRAAAGGVMLPPGPRQLQPRFSARCQLALSFGTEGGSGFRRWGAG